MKSSSCPGTAIKPICRRSPERLLFIGVVVFGAGEFIVGLQIMRTDVNGLGLRMATEIEGQRVRARLTAEQESDGRGARCMALQCFHDGAAQGCGSVLLQQLHQLCGLSTS